MVKKRSPRVHLPPGVKIRRQTEDYEQQIILLQKLGELTQKKYNQLISSNPYGYDLSFLKDALQFEADPVNEQNFYYIDAGSQRLNRMALYYEYGTGLYTREYGAHPYGSKIYYDGQGSYKQTVPAGRLPGNSYIKPKHNEYMKFRNAQGKWIFVKQVAGVKPGFYMTRAIDSTLHLAKSKGWI